MFRPRNALILAVAFFIVAGLYWWVQTFNAAWIDRTGITLLAMFGVAMAFGFWVIVRGARDL